MKRFSTRSPLLLLLLSAALLSGCSLFSPSLPETTKLKSSKVESPPFFLPPENLKDYQDRTWILLAESKSKNWFYDPYTLTEDEDNIVSYDAFISERGYDNVIHPFNATSIGPYRQKIDCFGNYQWSEIFYSQHMPNQSSYISPSKPDLQWGWIKIKPKTAMSYIRARVCGRKFLDDQSVNYFLFQEGKMQFVDETPNSSKGFIAHPLKSSVNPELVMDAFNNEPSLGAHEKNSSRPPFFYDVPNNEVIILDKQKNIRQMNLVSFVMDKNFSKRGEFTFIADCKNISYSFSPKGQQARFEKLTDQKSDFFNVAFNRACEDHGTYVKLISR